jgi:class 3 adenylate cyclase
MDPNRPEPNGPRGNRRRRLRAVFAADVANFTGLVSVDETRTLDALWVARRIAMEALETYGGVLFGLPGDGILALFESSIDAVRCALTIQTRLAATPKVSALRFRIGIHLGEVLFQDEQPFGESIVIACRLESLAEPGGVLISASVMDAVASRVSATFVEMGVRSLKHSPRRIATFSVSPPPEGRALDVTGGESELLDRTVLSLSRESFPRLQSLPRPVEAVVVAEPILPRLPKATPLVIPTLVPAEPPAVAEAPPSPLTPLPEDVPPPIVHPVEPVLPPIVHPPEPLAQPISVEAEHHSDLPQALIVGLSRVLTTHLGPFASVIVRRHADMAGDADHLVLLLAGEIPTEAERAQFRQRAQEVLERSR